MPICANGWAFYYLGFLPDVNTFIEKCKIKKANERKISKKILQCIVMLVMVVISFWIYVSVLSGRFNQYMVLVFLAEIIDVFMVTLVIKIFGNLIDIYFDRKENKEVVDK